MNNAAVDRGLQGFVLALLEEHRIVVRFRAVHPDDFVRLFARLRRRIDHELPLLPADTKVVERQVQIDVAVHDESVVSDDRHRRVLAVRQFDGLGHHLAVVGGDDEDVDAAGQQAGDVLDLHAVVGVG